jgi:hypothetical protein
MESFSARGKAISNPLRNWELPPAFTLYFPHAKDPETAYGTGKAK